MNLKDLSDYMDDPSMPTQLRDIAAEHNCSGEALRCMAKKLLNNSLVRYEFEILRNGKFEILRDGK